MAYQVDRFNGTFLVSVADGTIDTTTDLSFVGKNYAGYGELQNENFLHLLENFANTTAPPKRITGQIWYDSGNRKLKFYDGSKFKSANGAEVGATAPAGLEVGEFWFDTSSAQLYTWNGAEFVLIGPEAPPEFGTTAIVSEIVKDINETNHAIGKLLSGGSVVAIISANEFTLNSALNPIAGFGVIKKGITLVNTSPTTGVTTDDHFFWGTTSNSLKLNGFDSDDFVKSGNLSFNQQASFPDAGFTVGDQKDLTVRVEPSNQVIIENDLGNPIRIRIKVDESDRRVVSVFTKDGVFPGVSNFFDLGSSVDKWKEIHATSLFGNLTGNSAGSHRGNVQANDNSIAYNADTKTFFGNVGNTTSPTTVTGTLIGNVTGNVIGNATSASSLGGAISNVDAVPSTVVLRDSNANITASRFIGIANRADELRVDTNYRTASVAASANTLAVRNASGNLAATLFEGTATAARYADLAEKYLADKEYDTGTVVVVGGEAEVTAAAFGKRAIGVVSENPAFMMNKDLEGGTYIALKGRVPVKVHGPVKKGDKLLAYDNGTAIVGLLSKDIDVFAVALETNDSKEIKLVEAVIL